MLVDLAYQTLNDAVEGGVAHSMETILAGAGIDPDFLTLEDWHELDQYFFECQACNWTMPVEMQSGIADDLCLECKDG